jgi:hypothetical protein
MSMWNADLGRPVRSQIFIAQHHPATRFWERSRMSRGSSLPDLVTPCVPVITVVPVRRVMSRSFAWLG